MNIAEWEDKKKIAFTSEGEDEHVEWALSEREEKKRE